MSKINLFNRSTYKFRSLNKNVKTHPKMPDRTALRQILKAIGELSSNNLDSTSITEIRKLISEVSTSLLDIKLPEIKSSRIHNIYSATIYETSDTICSVFGIQKTESKIPLHDHTGSYGFIKVLRGAIRVKSFSLLDSRKERELIENRMKSGDFNDKYIRPVIYEGEQIATADDKVLMLSPSKSNIHEVVAIEDGTAFFDLLIPGYKCSTPCVYYKQFLNEPEVNSIAKPGEICWLKIVDMPRNYYTDILHYRQINTL